ncbi:MAG: GSCFA domain-containing protein, partial [Quisquiliibacterium sp.]
FQPYANLPDRQYWKPAVAEPYPLAIADLYRKKFPIAAQNAVATCGSCFAQHIGKRLRGRGYRYLDLEPAPAELKAEQAKALGYGLYSARYGNVYTSRQLLQLFQRAFDRLHFDENWQDKAGRFVDPFRPNLCGEGYATAEAMLDAQREHLQQVRRMFETLDVFVFTMGLTETWFNRETGAVYGGEMSAHHYFKDFAYCDSGMIPWLLVTALMTQTGVSLGDLVAAREVAFPCSGEINREVEDPAALLA